MNIKEFADMVEACFLTDAGFFYNASEDQKSDRIKKELLARGMEADCRKKYHGCSGICDLLIFDDAARESVTQWIEVKEIACHPQDKWIYPMPFKFFGEAPFKKDIANLSKVKSGEKWFLLFLLVYPDELPIEPATAPNPQQGKALSAAQVIRAVSRWAGGFPAEMRSLPGTKSECRAYLWDVCNCDLSEIEMRGKEYCL
jgi:hypothetical protein